MWWVRFIGRLAIQIRVNLACRSRELLWEGNRGCGIRDAQKDGVGESTRSVVGIDGLVGVRRDWEILVGFNVWILKLLALLQGRAA